MTTKNNIFFIIGTIGLISILIFSLIGKHTFNRDLTDIELLLGISLTIVFIIIASMGLRNDN